MLNNWFLVSIKNENSQRRFKIGFKIGLKIGYKIGFKIRLKIGFKIEFKIGFKMGFKIGFKIGLMLGRRQLSQWDTKLATSPWVIEKDANRLQINCNLESRLQFI